MPEGLEERLAEQVHYYRARAHEYDAWSDRRGAYDRGAHNPGWFAEKARLVAALGEFRPTGAVLEIAGGTGQWTAELARHADRLTVIDAAREALDRNRARLGSDGAAIDYHVADFFDWDPPRRYDAVFFSYWMSHVPPDCFEEFWERVAGCLAPGGRVFLIDNLETARAQRLDPEVPGSDERTVMRPAPDGRTYRVYKILWHPDDLRDALAGLGWTVEVFSTGMYFLWAEGVRTHDAAPGGAAGG